jgi:hypothetical protein
MKKNKDRKMDRLVEEIKSMPEPDYEQHFNQETQERIHRNLLNSTITQKKRKKFRYVLQPLILGVAGIATLLLFISVVIPFNTPILNNALNNKDYNFSGNVYNFPNQIVVKGVSNLPEGTLISIEKSDSEEQVDIYEDKVTIDSQGSFQFITKRLEKDKEYLLNFIIYSHVQPKRVKNILGERGQQLKNVKNTQGVFQYHKKETNYYGLKLMGVAYRVDSNEHHLLPNNLREIEEFEADYQ